MQGTGMILDLVDNLAECKYLDCPAFPIDFRHTGWCDLMEFRLDHLMEIHSDRLMEFRLDALMDCSTEFHENQLERAVIETG